MKLRYRFRFYPTKEQEQTLSKVFGSCRYVYNRGLRLRTDAWQNEGKHIGYKETSSALTGWKKQEETSWLNEVSCVPTQQSLRHLNTAFVRFFNKVGRYPTFKKKRNKQSAEYTRSAFKFSTEDPNNPNLKISGLGRLRIQWSRKIISIPTTVTIIKMPSEKYFISLCINEPKSNLAKTNKAVGIDLGINRLASLSDGTFISNPQFLKQDLALLKKHQRRLSKKIKGSGRWKKQRIKVARIYERIANKRLDHLQKVTTTLVQKYDRISMEDLNIRGMLSNRRLSRAISDVGMRTFRVLLEYKCQRYNKELILIDRFFPSSKRCHKCGFIVEKLPLNIRKWSCSGCTAEHDRDYNASINILNAAGQAVKARGDQIRRFKPSGLKRSDQRNANHLSN